MLRNQESEIRLTGFPSDGGFAGDGLGDETGRENRVSAVKR